MSTLQQHVTRNISSPDEIREFPHGSGELRVLDLGDEVLGHATFRPGWRWSNDMQETAGTHSCEVGHNLFVISGRMGIRMDDGSEFEIGPGDACFIAPGHDAWVLGSEPCVSVDWTGARTYAK
ncbi:MAG: cupin [Thermoleophilia bacterium]|nr:cupin [Thermoleophilia bacterium]